MIRSIYISLYREGGTSANAFQYVGIVPSVLQILSSLNIALLSPNTIQSRQSPRLARSNSKLPHIRSFAARHVNFSSNAAFRALSCTSKSPLGTSSGTRTVCAKATSRRGQACRTRARESQTSYAHPLH